MKNVKMGFSWIGLLATLEEMIECSDDIVVDQCDEMTLEDLITVIKAAQSADK